MVQYPFGRAISDPFHHISHTLVGAPDEHNGRPATPLGPHSILVHEEEDNGQADHQLEVEHDEQQVQWAAHVWQDGQDLQALDDAGEAQGGEGQGVLQGACQLEDQQHARQDVQDEQHGNIIVYYITLHMGNEPYKNLKQTILAHRENILKQEAQLVSSIVRRQKIIPERVASMTVTQIVDQLNSGRLTSEAVVAALGYRAVTVGRQLNLWTVTGLREALRLAVQCDRVRKETGMKNWTIDNCNEPQSNLLPPLYGIPISVKDVFNQHPFPTTLGLLSKALPLPSDSPLLTCFHSSGLIPFLRSNVPQYCMSAQTNNNLWGRSLNPWNRTRAVGGSSGGEGGLIAARCSVLGVGSDIGGSVRLPSEHCGVFGLKPCSERISNTYHAELSKAVTGMTKAIPLCIGPLAKSPQDLALFMKTVTTQQYFKNTEDPYTKIIPFDTARYRQNCKREGNKWKIGFVKQIADIQPSPTSARALREVVEVLKGLGHQVVEVEIPREREIVREYLTELTASGAKLFREMLAGQKPTVQNKMVIDILQLSRPMSILAAWYSKLLIPRAYYYSYSKRVSSVLAYQTHVGEICQLRRQWISHWKAQKLDFLLCPGFPCQAIPHGQSNKLGYVLAYCFIWNLLDMAVGSVPVTIVREDQQFYQSKEIDVFVREMKSCAKGSIGLPAGVQIVGLPWKEEEVLGLMTLLEREIKFYQKFPLPNPETSMRVPGGFEID